MGPGAPGWKRLYTVAVFVCAVEQIYPRPICIYHEEQIESIILLGTEVEFAYSMPVRYVRYKKAVHDLTQHV